MDVEVGNVKSEIQQTPYHLVKLYFFGKNAEVEARIIGEFG